MATPAICVLYSKIVLDALSVSKIKLNKCRRDFMIEIFMLYLRIPSRINFLQLGRYSLFGKQRFRRQILLSKGLTSLASIKPCRSLGLASVMPLPSIIVSFINQARKPLASDTFGRVVQAEHLEGLKSLDFQ